MKITSAIKHTDKIRTFLLYVRQLSKNLPIRDTAKAMGYMVSSLPGVLFVGIHYRGPKISTGEFRCSHGYLDQMLRSPIYEPS